MQYVNEINLYTDIILPPEGYKIDWLEITTWSLAKDFLRLIPAMIIAGNQDIPPKKIKHPNKYIRAEKEKGQRQPFHIFYDGKNRREYEESTYFMTADGKYAQYILNEYCSPINLADGLFHPKIILVQFKNGDQYKFRVCISSKNLTWSRYLEAGVILESGDVLFTENDDELQEDEDEKENLNKAGIALSKFFEKYYKNQKENSEKTYKIMCKLLKKAKFAVMVKRIKDGKIKLEKCCNCNREENEIIEVEPQIYFNRNSKLIDILNSRYKEVIVKNGEKCNLRICSMKPTEEIFEIGNFEKIEYICNFKDIYEPEQPESNIWKKKEKNKKNLWYVGIKEDSPKNLHIKSYSFWKNKSKILTFIGSANCSENGLRGKNEEVLVEFCRSSSNENDFPCKGPGGKFVFVNKEDKEYKCFNNATVEDPKVVEIEDEEVLFRYKITIEDECYKNKKVKFKATNNEDASLQIMLATNSEVEELAANSKKTIVFDVDENNYTNLLLIRKKGSSEYMSYILSELGWHGKDYDGLKKDLPIEETKDINDWFEWQDFFKENDSAFEKVTKCKIFLEDKKCEEYLGLVNSYIERDEKIVEDARKVLDSEELDSEELDQNTMKLMDMFDKYKQEINDLKGYLQEVGGK